MAVSVIEKCVQQIVDKQNIKNYQFEIEGGSSKGDGYLGDITFVTIIGQTESNIKKKFDIVIKSAAKSKRFRERVPIRNCFMKEIYHYETVVPVFKNLQKDENVQGLLNYIPDIYASQKTEGNEFLALENLKMKGFSVWD